MQYCNIAILQYGNIARAYCNMAIGGRQDLMAILLRAKECRLCYAAVQAVPGYIAIFHIEYQTILQYCQY
jgi:hypothetical protein